MVTLIELSQLLQATWNLSVFYYVQHRKKKLTCLGRRYLIGQQFQVVNIRGEEVVASFGHTDQSLALKPSKKVVPSL